MSEKSNPCEPCNKKDCTDCPVEAESLALIKIDIEMNVTGGENNNLLNN